MELSRHGPADTGNAYYYLCAAVGALASDEYFMINPFSRGLMAPNQALTNWCGARFNYSINRLQIYSVGTTGWRIWVSLSCFCPLTRDITVAFENQHYPPRRVFYCMENLCPGTEKARSQSRPDKLP